MNRRTLIILSIVIVAGLLTAVARKESAARSWEGNDDAKKLKFSHELHVGTVGAACQDCHKAALTSTQSSDNLRANHDNCVSCHEEQINNTCGFCHKDPDNIEPSSAPRREIVFSHAQHLAMKDVECTKCHVGLEKVDYAGPQNMPPMETCNTCHNDMKATNQCQACHTTLTNLIPANHLAANFKKEHAAEARIGALNVDCKTCHTQDFCAQCHAPAGLMGFGKKDLMADPTPKTSPSDQPQLLTLQSAHGMNYKFTHGIDAKAKSADCYSCHSYQNFCAECHATGGNVTQSSFMPTWHLGGGFTTLGVGSGGGRHAQFARRDIESCATCHDVRGADPVCTTCHTDPDGIRGSDPKTHEAGFMKGQHGNWHTSQGAVCYTCHTDANAHPGGTKGVGFCGYCHN